MLTEDSIPLFWSGESRNSAAVVFFIWTVLVCCFLQPLQPTFPLLHSNRYTAHTHSSNLSHFTYSCAPFFRVPAILYSPTDRLYCSTLTISPLTVQAMEVLEGNGQGSVAHVLPHITNILLLGGLVLGPGHWGFTRTADFLLKHLLVLCSVSTRTICSHSPPLLTISRFIHQVSSLTSLLARRLKCYSTSFINIVIYSL